MNTSLSWIKKYVPDLDVSAQEYTDAMTLTGTKVEGFEKLDADLDKIVVGQIEKIEKIKGVDSVLIETQYEPCVVKESETTDPNMATSSSMIGSSVAWADGYTGAGSKVAIIDTGADTDHPSLSGAAYSYAVKGLGITPVTAADYADKLEKLNALKKTAT